MNYFNLIQSLICYKLSVTEISWLHIVGWKSRNDGIRNSEFGTRNSEYSEYPVFKLQACVSAISENV